MYIIKIVSYSSSSYTNDFLICQGFISFQPVKAVLLWYWRIGYTIFTKNSGSISSNLIINGSLDVKTNITLPGIGDVEDTIQGKQDTIQDGDLTIAKTSGLQTALDDKYNKTGGSITGSVDITGGLVVGTTNIITELGNKQPTINDGDLTIAKTSGLQQ